MLTNLYVNGWLEHLDNAVPTLPHGEHLFLLLDSAFLTHMVPSLDSLAADIDKAFLFAHCPGFNDEMRQVSPVLMPYVSEHVMLRRLLHQCSGYPMLSVLRTAEPLAELSQRLAAWCIVHIDGDALHLRLADTRRLPDLHRVLTPEQRAQLMGPAASWDWMGRHGLWHAQAGSTQVLPPADPACLSPEQFEALLAASEIDYWLSQLDAQAWPEQDDHATRYAKMEVAVQAAREAGLSEGDIPAWCTHYLGQWFEPSSASSPKMSVEQASTLLQSWRQNL